MAKPASEWGERTFGVSPKNPWSLLLLTILLLMPGCGGCFNRNTAKNQKEEEEAKKRASLERKIEPFTFGKITPLPSEVQKLSPISTDLADLESEEEKKRKEEEEKRRLGNRVALNFVKPGHWTGIVLPLRSNQADLAGDLIASTIDPKTTELAEVENTLYRFTLSRPITLAKGQTKYLDAIAYVPKSLQSGAVNIRFRNELISGGRRLLFIDEPTTRLNTYQYFFLVLASNPDQYTFLRISSFNSPSADVEDEGGRFYHVVAPKFENEIPLPNHPATWTNLAYILWDEVDAKRVDPEAQQAMIDWLHWGGQLIINGPRSLDMLRGTFLDEHLPAAANKTRTLDAEALSVLNDNWYIPPRTEFAEKDTRRKLQLGPNETVAGIELVLRPGGQFVPRCGDLIAERRVGRGRIVVTGFPLYQRAFLNWSCYDNLLNNAILRRLPRQYFVPDLADESMRFVAKGVVREDPRVATTLRYFCRDIGYDSAAVFSEQDPRLNSIFNWSQSQEDLEDARQRFIERASAADVEGYDWHFCGYAASAISGVAGWTDSGPCPTAARNALTEAAGIKIPERSFVLRMMLIYLTALVPINWLIFRLIGRLEYAWVAAPIMAIIAAVAVIRFAQLDIGFARSQTEVNIVEAHGGYDRAHVARYAALYTSLSSSYRIAFDDPSAVALPMARTSGENDSFMPRLTDTYRTVTMERETQVELRGFGVDSNSTGLLHAEHMLSLGGAFQLVGDNEENWSVQNDTQLKVDAAIALYRDDAGVLKYCPLGEISTKARVPLTWRDVPQTSSEQNRPSSIETVLSEEIDKLDRSIAPEGEQEHRLKLRRLIELACGKLKVAPGEVRLIAALKDRPPGMDVRPRAPQITAATMLIVHLKHASLPPPQSDVNLQLDVKPPRTDDSNLLDPDLKDEADATDIP